MKLRRSILILVVWTAGTGIASADVDCKKCQQYATVALEVGKSYGCPVACGLTPVSIRPACNKNCDDYLTGKCKKEDCVLKLCQDSKFCPENK